MDHHINRNIRLFLLFLFLICFSISAFIRENDSAAAQSSAPSKEWQPNIASATAHYAGSNKCVSCHENKITQRSTAMAKASATSEDCQVLRSNPLLSFRSGPFSYKITREGDRSIYTVTNGKETFSEPILYCFGKGKFGQTYILRHNGALYESRISFYAAIKGLDITIGHDQIVPGSIEEAAGRRISHGEARDCFGCHTTAAATKTEIHTDRLLTGVNCESCHGPGERHIAAMNAGEFKEGRNHIFNPAGLETEEISNFCGNCHRSWEQVVLTQQAMRRNGQEMGINSVRFQPYRLTNSKCYDLTDRRISCLGCHNPHKELETNPAFYDSKCAACHSSNKNLRVVGKRIAKLCRVGKRNCVSCHMPATELPTAHTVFRDHLIRVVRRNESVW